MKYFLALLLTVSQMAVAGQCVIRQVGQMTSDRKVGAVTDLVKSKNPNSCNVKFRIAVDGEFHTIDWTQTGLYQEEILCRMAIEHGTRELMSRLPGNFKSESITVCGDPQTPKRVSKGDEGMENEFGKDRQYQNYFKVGKVSNCRKFQNRYIDGKTLRAEGVICENKDQLWTVIDVF